MSIFCHLLQDVIFESGIDHGGQVTSLFPAEVLGSSPVLGVVGVLAVPIVLFPAILARVDALIICAV